MPKLAFISKLQGHETEGGGLDTRKARHIGTGCMLAGSRSRLRWGFERRAFLGWRGLVRNGAAPPASRRSSREDGVL